MQVRYDREIGAVGVTNLFLFLFLSLSFDFFEFAHEFGGFVFFVVTESMLEYTSH